MAQTILYYPNINIQDGIWLRNAILYWDEVSSIVPYENYADFSPELLYLQNTGIYRAVYPQDLFFSRYAEDFCNCVMKRINAYGSIITRNNQNKTVKIHNNKLYGSALYKFVHKNKLPQNVQQLFKDMGYVDDDNVDGWVEMDQKVAQIYMKTLAEYSIKCSNKDIVLGTETATHNREIYSNIYSSIDSKNQCCKINIEKCLPQPARDVSFEDILDFKVRRRDELLDFRTKIRELEANIYNADSVELIKHYEDQFVESWEKCSNDFYKVLKEARIKFLLGSLVSIVAIPFIGQVMARNWGENLSAAIQMGDAAINIGINYFNYKDKISPMKTDGAFSYIIKANKNGIIYN